MDLAGQTFGRLTVIERVAHIPRPHWLCRCECGTERIVRADNLRRGLTRSCGCFHREQWIASVSTHGHLRNGEVHPLYWTWASMHQRCRNPNHARGTRWMHYGGRGITVCERWGGRDGFAHFIADMGERPDRHTLDRVDPDGNYEPGNCRWATYREQNLNRSKRSPAPDGLSRT
jgi:hypothetical protein